MESNCEEISMDRKCDAGIARVGLVEALLANMSIIGMQSAELIDYC